MDQRTDSTRNLTANGHNSGAFDYMPGFGNDFETEALPGSLPQGMNSPQKMRLRALWRAAFGNRVHGPQPSE